eukprot:scaffold94256_cov16-Tisochrysis_lutea.AAC.1
MQDAALHCTAPKPKRTLLEPFSGTLALADAQDNTAGAKSQNRTWPDLLKVRGLTDLPAQSAWPEILVIVMHHDPWRTCSSGAWPG